ncbi:hypothetical protein ACQR0Z_14895 [Bradyrhizobium sp. HKCCYLS3077]|uniref:hypothetical protein n=1 Tax=Bradyrhizobium sp. HKCCYLS3077 TaxID=3420761 RepID=UPI003EC03DBA
MFDYLNKHASAISLATISTLAIFNVGYFWKIGIHFLGLIDISNLVYSLGVSLTAISIGGAITAIVVRASSAWLQILLAGIGATVSTWGIVYFQPRTLDPQLPQNFAILIGFILPWAAFTGRLIALDHAQKWSNLAWVGLGWWTIIFQAGICQVSIELADRFMYVVNTKAGVIVDARILRSSSAGLLLVVDKRITFIPQGEIRAVSLQNPE